MTAKDRMLNYMPPYYRSVPVINALLDADGKEIDSLNLSIQDVLEQFFIETATWGLRFWEEEYALPINENLAFEIRRKRILVKKRKGRGNLVQELKAFEPTITLAWGRLILPFTLQSDDDIYDFGPLIDLLERRKPAHLGYSFTVIGGNGDYTVYANHKNRNKVNLGLETGTTKTGRWPRWNTHGQLLVGQAVSQSVPATGVCVFPMAGVSVGSVDRAIVAMEAEPRQGVYAFPRSGIQAAGVIPVTSTPGNMTASGAELVSTIANGICHFYRCGALHAGEVAA